MCDLVWLGMIQKLQKLKIRFSKVPLILKHPLKRPDTWQLCPKLYFNIFRHIFLRRQHAHFWGNLLLQHQVMKNEPILGHCVAARAEIIRIWRFLHHVSSRILEFSSWTQCGETKKTTFTRKLTILSFSDQEEK